MSSSFGKQIKISIFGQSHSAGIGVVIDGLPSGEVIDLNEVQEFMTRRAPGNHAYATPRKEADQPEILSGLFDGKTCGAPLCAVIHNTNTRSCDYRRLQAVPRPGHADYTAVQRYGESRDYTGGGHFSGRLTAPLCFAGAVCMQILRRRGIEIGAHILSIGDITDESFDEVAITAKELQAVTTKEFPVLNEGQGQQMIAAVAEARQEGDSLGGIVELCALGIPAGVGSPIFDGLENRLAQAVFGIPAVKGIEFGLGFAAAKCKGSENNDAFFFDQNGEVKTRTNHHGGILGGISSGMPIIMRAAFKPTPSIGKEQESVNLEMGTEAKLAVTGRHDPCIVPRAVPCVEAAAAVVLLDMLMENRSNGGM